MQHQIPSRVQHSAILFSTCVIAAIVGLVGLASAQTETLIASPGITYAGVIFDSVGNLYGVTQLGGSSSNCGHDGCGTVFELSPASGGAWTQTVIYDFQGLADGSEPYAGLVFDASGNLYGTTEVGGAGGGGTVFELSPGTNGSWILTTLYSFQAPNDALYPNSSLIFDHAGNLFGTTVGGGTYGLGTVFELSPSSGSWKENILRSFGGPGDGASPHGPLVLEAQGNLYGTTQSGGSGDVGTVFELSHHPGGGWVETILHNFAAGGQPLAGLILDATHDLYGTTFSGGAVGYGSVFRLSRVSSGGHFLWRYSSLYSFTNGTDGANPSSPLTLDSAGNLYGTTDGGFPTGCNSFYGCGQFFKLSVNSAGHWNISALYPVPQFLYPNGSLVLNSAGDIYGTAIDSHYFAYGDVFQVTQ